MDDAQVCWPPDEQTLSVLTDLAEELFGHLLLLVAAVDADYVPLPSGARLRLIVDGSARVAGALPARPAPPPDPLRPCRDRGAVRASRSSQAAPKKWSSV
ncbi:hypothetical protein [Kitasatospora sp. NPDC088351]|uniref:hypothetical protein n=1 Tax=unclassified Kitasatospora TaxID=2633591 RepID=UPI00342F461C